MNADIGAMTNDLTTLRTTIIFWKENSIDGLLRFGVDKKPDK